MIDWFPLLINFSVSAWHFYFYLYFVYLLLTLIDNHSYNLPNSQCNVLFSSLVGCKTLIQHVLFIQILKIDNVLINGINSEWVMLISFPKCVCTLDSTKWVATTISRKCRRRRWSGSRVGRGPQSRVEVEQVVNEFSCRTEGAIAERGRGFRH